MTRHLKPFEHYNHIASGTLRHLWPDLIYNYLLPIVTEQQLHELDYYRTVVSSKDTDKAILDWCKDLEFEVLFNRWQIIELNDLWLVRSDIYKQFKAELMWSLADIDIEPDYYKTEI